MTAVYCGALQGQLLGKVICRTGGRRRRTTPSTRYVTSGQHNDSGPDRIQPDNWRNITLNKTTDKTHVFDMAYKSRSGAKWVEPHWRLGCGPNELILPIPRTKCRYCGYRAEVQRLYRSGVHNEHVHHRATPSCGTAKQKAADITRRPRLEHDSQRQQSLGF